MRYLALLRHRLRSLFRRPAVDDELERELRLHIEQLTRELMTESGLSEEEARRAARLRFGSPVAAREQCRDVRRVNVLEDFARDTRYAARILARSPGFTLTAVLSLALGIGANTAIFSLMDAVLLRTLPVERPRDLVFLGIVGSAGPSGAPPYPCFDRFRKETSAFAGIAAFTTDHLRLDVDGQAEQVYGQVASANYFDTLGVRPMAGRLLSEGDEIADSAVAVIGHGYWQRRFGGSMDAIGRTVTYKGRAYTIVGVTPPAFHGLEPGRDVEVTLPITAERGMLADAGAFWFSAIARLRVGVPAEQGRAQVDAIFQSFMQQHSRWDPDMRRAHFDHMELTSALRGLGGLRTRFGASLIALGCVAGAVLLIACANLGNLLLVRGAARERELAIRLATGAGVGRLLRQLLTETLLLFALGGVASVAVAVLTIRALTGFVAIGRNPILLDVRYDWRLVAFATGVALVAGVVTGVWPALRAVRTAPHAAMKDGDGRVAGSARVGAASRFLGIGQVALSLVLVVVAIVFVRTMINLSRVDLGFSGTRVLTMSLDPRLPPGATAEARAQFWKQVLTRVRAMPGVRTATLSVLTPLSGRDVGKLIEVRGFEPRSDTDRLVHVNHVSEDYFETFGIQAIGGRGPLVHDEAGAPRVVAVNEAAAKAFFAGRNPIGEEIRFGEAGAYRVVGVIRDHKHRNVREEVPRFAYVPLWQPVEGITRITLSVSSKQQEAALTRAIVDEVRAVEPTALVSDVLGVQEQIDATLVTERLLSTLAAGFAVLALVVAAIGLYGVLSYALARRTTELGVRLALGARPAHVAWSVFRGVVGQVAIGIAIGAPFALAAVQAAEGLLFGVTSAEPWSYVLGAAMLTAVACLAAWLPAHRAASIDPCHALRHQSEPRQVRRRPDEEMHGDLPATSISTPRRSPGSLSVWFRKRSWRRSSAGRVTRSRVTRASGSPPDRPARRHASG